MFPSYSELQVQLSNHPQDEKASRSTVSRALLMLRLTRWLSLCHKARDRVSGHILGNVYALHDKPLSVLDAVRFDASYLLATLRKAQDGEFNQYRRGKAAVPESVPPVVSDPEGPAKPRKKRDISKLVAEIRAQCLGSG